MHSLYLFVFPTMSPLHTSESVSSASLIPRRNSSYQLSCEDYILFSAPGLRASKVSAPGLRTSKLSKGET